jgi:hypothetical protein
MKITINGVVADDRSSDVLERLRFAHWECDEDPNAQVLGDAVDEIVRLRDASDAMELLRWLVAQHVVTFMDSGSDDGGVDAHESYRCLRVPPHLVDIARQLTEDHR